MEHDEEHYESLADEIFYNMKLLKWNEAFTNKALYFPQFQTTFLKYTHKVGYGEIKSLFLLSQPTDETIIKNLKRRKYDTTDISEDEENWAEHLLLDMKKDDNDQPIYNVRGVSWVVYYGHSFLLQDLIDRVLTHEESTELVFGTAISEQARLLVLACQNADANLIKLLIDHVNPDSINKTPQSGGIYDLYRDNTPLTTACSRGELPIVDCLVEAGADVNLTDGWFYTPLMAACHSGHVEIVDALLNHKADVNKCGRFHESALYYASCEGDPRMVRHLLDHGAETEIHDSSFETSLYAASERGHSDVVRELIKHHANVNVQAKCCMSPLFVAAKNGHYKIVQTLIDCDGIKPASKNCSGISPLHIAILNNKPKVVEILIRGENKIGNWKGNRHLFEILLHLRQCEVYFNDMNGFNDVAIKSSNLYNLSSELLNEIQDGESRDLERLLQIGLDVNFYTKKSTEGEEDQTSLLDIVIFDEYVRKKVSKVKMLFKYGFHVSAVNILEKLRGKIKEYNEEINTSMFQTTHKEILYRESCEVLKELRKHIRRHSF